jgi:hypothetical protein
MLFLASVVNSPHSFDYLSMKNAQNEKKNSLQIVNSRQT